MEEIKKILSQLPEGHAIVFQPHHSGEAIYFFIEYRKSAVVCELIELNKVLSAPLSFAIQPFIDRYLKTL